MDTIAILNTGDELLSGEIINTNAAWLAQECHQLGWSVCRQLVVGDDRATIRAACLELAAQADIVLVTGGLGPTSDDVTLAAAAEAFECALVCHEPTWQLIQERFAQRGLVCTQNNRQQAMIPAGGEIIANALGTAPGVRIVFQRATFWFFPGVPHELEAMARGQLLPWLQQQRRGHVIGQRTLRCFGLAEATLAEQLASVSLEGIRLGYRVIFPEVLVKLIAEDTRAAELNVRLAHAEASIRQSLGEVVIGSGTETMAGVVGGLLIKHQASLAVAESCTGGLLSSAITDVPGASVYFERGLVAYSNRTKHELLGVSRSDLSRYGAVSREVAMAMATQVRQRAQTTYGLSVTGIAGPSGGSIEKPVGTVYIALAGPETTQVHYECYPRDRVHFKSYVTALALNLLRKVLL